MGFTLDEMAAITGGRAEGRGDLRCERLAHPSRAGAGDLAVALDAEHAGLLAECQARAALVGADVDWRAAGLDGVVVVERGRYALALATEAGAPPIGGPPGAHPSAAIDPSAEIDPSASIGPFCVVGAGARIGAHARLIAQSHLGRESVVGEGSLLHPGVRVGGGVRIGARAILHPNAVIGSDGFSFVTPSPGAVESVRATGRVADDMRNLRFARIHSLGGVEIGDDVEIGANATIDSGTLAPTRIGSGTKIDNLVQIGHNVVIGSNCLICGQVGIAGSTVVGDRVVLGGQTGVGDHCHIGSDVVAGARTGISGKVPDGAVILGAPWTRREEAIQIFMALRRLPGLVKTVRELQKRLAPPREH